MPFAFWAYCSFKAHKLYSIIPRNFLEIKLCDFTDLNESLDNRRRSCCIPKKAFNRRHFMGLRYYMAHVLSINVFAFMHCIEGGTRIGLQRSNSCSIN